MDKKLKPATVAVRLGRRPLRLVTALALQGLGATELTREASPAEDLVPRDQQGPAAATAWSTTSRASHPAPLSGSDRGPMRSIIHDRAIQVRQRYLEVTFRNGKPLAAYLYLPRTGRVTVASTRDAGNGLKVDFDAGGTPVGVEITAPSIVSVASLNAVLAGLGVGTIDAGELGPLAT